MMQNNFANPQNMSNEKYTAQFTGVIDVTLYYIFFLAKRNQRNAINEKN